MAGDEPHTTPLSDLGQIVAGGMIVAWCHFVYLGIFAGIGNSVVAYRLQDELLFGLWYIGIAQFFYVLPLTILCVRSEKHRMMGAGLLLGAGLTFLLNSTCTGLIALLERMH